MIWYKAGGVLIKSTSAWPVGVGPCCWRMMSGVYRACPYMWNDWESEYFNGEFHKQQMLSHTSTKRFKRSRYISTIFDNSSYEFHINSCSVCVSPYISCAPAWIILSAYLFIWNGDVISLIRNSIPTVEFRFKRLIIDLNVKKNVMHLTINGKMIFLIPFIRFMAQSFQWENVHPSQKNRNHFPAIKFHKHWIKHVHFQYEPHIIPLRLNQKSHVH